MFFAFAVDIARNKLLDEYIQNLIQTKSLPQLQQAMQL